MIFKIYIDKFNRGRRYCSIDEIQSPQTLVTAGILLQGDKTEIHSIDFTSRATVSIKLLCGNQYYYNSSGAVPACTFCQNNVIGNSQTFGVLLQQSSQVCRAPCNTNIGAPEASVLPQSRSVCTYTCSPNTNVGPNCQTCNSYRGLTIVSPGVTFSRVCQILTCPNGQHQLNGICIPNSDYYQLTDPCLNVQISSLADCANCVNRGCTYYQNNICAFFRSDAVQNWQRQTLFTSHPDAKFCPTQGQAPTCTSHSSLNSDKDDLKVFSQKPNFIGFKCVFKLSSSDKDIRIKLKRGQNQLGTQFNERIYLTIWRGGSSFEYISNTEFNTVNKRISLNQNNFVQIYYLKTSNHDQDSVLTVEIDSDFLTDDLYLVLVIVGSVIGSLLFILLLICLIAGCRKRLRIKREKLLFIKQNRAEVKVIDQYNGMASRAIIKRDKKIQMSKRDSQALNKKLRVRATYTDRNTQSSMISVNDRQQFLNFNEGSPTSPNMRRSSIVVDHASKFTTPFQGQKKFDYRPYVHRDDIQLIKPWDKNQDCTYIENKKNGCTMKSDAYYMAKRLQAQSKTNTTRSTIAVPQRAKKGSFSRSQIENKRRLARSSITTEEDEIHNPRQSTSLISNKKSKKRRQSSLSRMGKNGGDQFPEEQHSIGQLSSIVGNQQNMRKFYQQTIESPNYQSRKKAKSTFGKPPLPTRKFSKRRNSVEGLTSDPPRKQYQEEKKKEFHEQINHYDNSGLKYSKNSNTKYYNDEDDDDDQIIKLQRPRKKKVYRGEEANEEDY